MADNVAITAGSGTTIACDEVVDGTLGTVKVQFTKLMDGTLDSTNKLVIDSSGRASTLPSPYILQSAGTAQYGLSITTNTTLTVPANTRLAQISVETANVRWTDDGTSASTTVGHLAPAGTAFSYAGPLASMKFTAVSGSPTINVTYYK
jgi:hypothetical protein